MRYSSILLIAITSAFLSSSFASAQEETTTVHVNSSDLNLANSRGVEVLRVRVARAVDEVCGGAVDAADLNDLSLKRQCRSTAQRSAEAQMVNLIAAAKGVDRSSTTFLASR